MSACAVRRALKYAADGDWRNGTYCGKADRADDSPGADSIEGLTDDKIANAEMGRTTIQLTGGYGFIGALSTEDIRLFVDVSGLEAGTYNLPVQVHIDNAPEFTCALASPQISVVIRNK